MLSHLNRKPLSNTQERVGSGFSKKSGLKPKRNFKNIWANLGQNSQIYLCMFQIMWIYTIAWLSSHCTLPIQNQNCIPARTGALCALLIERFRSIIPLCVTQSLSAHLLSRSAAFQVWHTAVPLSLQLYLSRSGADMGGRPGGVPPVPARPPVADGQLRRSGGGGPLPVHRVLPSKPDHRQRSRGRRRRRLRYADCVRRPLVSWGQLTELRVHQGNAAVLLTSQMIHNSLWRLCHHCDLLHGVSNNM